MDIKLKKKTANPIKHRKCQRIINDNLLTTSVEKVCGRPVTPPNRFLCQNCLRLVESEEQALGYFKRG